MKLPQSGGSDPEPKTNNRVKKNKKNKAENIPEEAAMEKAAEKLAGDPDAERRLEDIRISFEALKSAMVTAKDEIAGVKAEVQKSWSTLKESIEESIPSDQGAIAKLDAVVSKLERTELAWQEYEEAKSKLRETTKDARANVKAARATLERAIAYTETKQTNLF